ncbi:MAG: cobalamin-dependent protein, partial [Spirochaetia bacterium]|nr:cobalamin-dependent protein [Spirochaetia bacterium]
AARCRATLGEISSACEKVFGRFSQEIHATGGVYIREMKDDARIQKVLDLSNRFSELEGRRPRILIAKLGQDGHDRGARVVAAGLADLGFDVDISPLFTIPEEVAKQAADNDVHAVGVSSLAGGHLTLIPQLMDELHRLDRDDILVVAGGILPDRDIELLKEKGLASAFTPGTSIVDSAETILLSLIEKISNQE